MPAHPDEKTVHASSVYPAFQANACLPLPHAFLHENCQVTMPVQRRLSIFISETVTSICFRRLLSSRVCVLIEPKQEAHFANFPCPVSPQGISLVIPNSFLKDLLLRYQTPGRVIAALAATRAAYISSLSKALPDYFLTVILLVTFLTPSTP